MRMRRGGPDDVPAVLALLDDAVRWLVERGRTEQWGDRPFSSVPARVELIEGWAAREELWVAVDDDQVVGALVVGPPPEHVPATTCPELYVLLLVTARARRGSGIGAELVAHARREGVARGVERVRVDCWAGGGGALVDVYVRLGFTPTDRFEIGGWAGQVLELRLDAAGPRVAAGRSVD